MTPTIPEKRFSLPALLATTGTCALLLTATDRMIGGPDLSLVGEFASGGRPTHEAGLATASLLVWTVLLGICAWLILSSWNGLPHIARRSVPTVVDPGIVVMVIGICLLAIAVAHQTAQPPRMCCGSMQEAAQNLGH